MVNYYEEKVDDLFKVEERYLARNQELINRSYAGSTYIAIKGDVIIGHGNEWVGLARLVESILPDKNCLITRRDGTIEVVVGPLTLGIKYTKRHLARSRSIRG